MTKVDRILLLIAKARPTWRCVWYAEAGGYWIVYRDDARLPNRTAVSGFVRRWNGESLFDDTKEGALALALANAFRVWG